MKDVPRVIVKTTSDPKALAEHIANAIDKYGEPSDISFSTCGVVEVLYSVLIVWW